MLHCIQHIHNKGMVHKSLKAAMYAFHFSGHPMCKQLLRLRSVHLIHTKYYKRFILTIFSPSFGLLTDFFEIGDYSFKLGMIAVSM